MGSQYAASRRRGRIVFNNRRSSVDCFVCGLSPFGATIEVTDARSLPSRFDLLVDGEATARAATVHDVSDETLGVVFANAPAGQKASFGRKQPPANDAAHLASNDFLHDAEFGLVMVSPDMRATLVNKVFRQFWKVSDALSESNPPLAELLRNGPIETAPTATIADIVSRTKLGTSTPLDIRMTGNDVLRFHCITLPGGRRLLTFTNVTDFAQRIDELEVLRGAIDNVDQGIVVLDRDLRVRFVNKKARELWRLKPEQCDNWPSFAHFLYDIAATGIYDVPEGKLEDYVLLRYTTVQSGNPAPMDVRIQGGRIIRAQCTALPCDGRMLTHTDVTDLVQRADFHEQQSMLDPLTGLPNRRSFLALAEAEWERFNRYHQPFSLIAFDLDSLKAINDGLGHEAGDRAIRQIARVCNAEKRCSDVVARLGGDEFVILMPGTTADVAHSFADRLRMSIASQPLLPENARLTVSMGVAEAIAETDGVTGLLKVADDRLYAAKRKGRGLSAAADLSLTPELAEPASDEPRTVN